MLLGFFCGFHFVSILFKQAKPKEETGCADCVGLAWDCRLPQAEISSRLSRVFKGKRLVAKLASEPV